MLFQGVTAVTSNALLGDLQASLSNGKNCALQANGRLKTPGLFVNSVDLAHAASPRPPSSEDVEDDEAAAVHELREALDRGEEVRLLACSRPSTMTVFEWLLPELHAPGLQMILQRVAKQLRCMVHLPPT